MQFAYEFPERTERLVLVSSGGLGPEVSSILRAAALPGAGVIIGATAALASSVGGALARGLAVVGLRPRTDVAEVVRGYSSLADRDRRAALLATLRGVIDTGGQRVHAGDRQDLAEGMPMLIIWGERDSMIPLRHGQNATRRSPAVDSRSSKGSVICRTLEAPGGLIAVLERFMAETEPAWFDSDRWRRRLRHAGGEP
jgi:pimeloyl-ACP methyl ester carboxylesterase